jgi:hypothetical protein
LDNLSILKMNSYGHWISRFFYSISSTLRFSSSLIWRAYKIDMLENVPKIESNLLKFKVVDARWKPPSHGLVFPTSLWYFFRLIGFCWMQGVRLRATSHTREWEPMTITLQALSLVENMEPVQVCFTLRLRDHRSMWMQDGCKVYMDSYMASNESRFMVTRTNFKNHHHLEVGLTQNRVTMALQTLTTIDLFYFIMREDLHK